MNKNMTPYFFKKWITKEKIDSGVYLINHLLSGLFPFLVLPVLVSVLGLADIGRWSIFAVFIAFFRPLSGLSLSSQLMRKFYSLSDKEVGEEAGRIFILTFLFSAALAIGLACITGSPKVLGIETSSFLYIPPIVFFNNGAELALRILRMEGKSVKSSAFEFSINFTAVCLDILFVCFFKIGWMSFVYSRVIVYFTAFLIAIFWLYRRYPIVFRFDFEKMKLTLAVGAPIAVHIVGGILIGMTDRIVLERMFSLEIVGIYSIGCMAAGGLNAFNMAVNKAWGPWVLRKLSSSDTNRKHLIANKTHQLACVMVLIALGMGVIGKYYLNWFMGPDFQPAETVLYWALAALLMQGFYQTLTHHVMFLGKTSIFMKATLSVGIFNLFLTILLANTFGMIGAIQATVISFSLQFLILLIYVQKNCGLPKLFFIRSF